ncbi:hypothetical protein L4D20_05170 [Vibrio kyushuensis]|uniref:hypothetical protein n=1 Tax=Vibrio kyushuensis TaxID=2910249 RepID=UPI003D0F0529
MSELTPQQEHAKAIFKTNLHLPNGGFHGLIIELSKEYQLPFQKVRTVLMTSQKIVEEKINSDFENVSEQDLSKEHWIGLIHLGLRDLAKETTAVMTLLEGNSHYNNAKAGLLEPITSEGARDAILEELFCAYEKIVFKPLLAMLHTSPLYWKLMLLEELYQMTEEKRQQFELYPQYMQATETLFILDQKIRNIELVDSL